MLGNRIPRMLLSGSRAIAQGLVKPSGWCGVLNSWRVAPPEDFDNGLVKHLHSGSSGDEQPDQSGTSATIPARIDTEQTLAIEGMLPSTRHTLTRLEMGVMDADITRLICNQPNFSADSLAERENAIAQVGGEMRSNASEMQTYRLGSHEPTLEYESSLHGNADGNTFSRQPTSESRYRKVRSHASGGLGEVFVAVDAELNREVALKEIKVKHADTMQSRSRFVLEAEVTGGLEHPGIVPVYGLGQYADGRPYYAMRFIRGESLKQAVDRFHDLDETPKRSRSEREVEFRALLGRFIDVCEAMAYAHSRGVIHRDLKPANIMVGNFGETLIVDWGLAKAQGRDDPQMTLLDQRPLVPLSAVNTAETLEGSALGTPQYMSPEQAAGRLADVGPASDVYSLGATLYYLMTGVAPFTDMTVGLILYKVQRGEFAAPRSLDNRIPRALDAICRKAMALEPRDRYQACKELARDICLWMADEPVASYREPIHTRIARWSRRHRTLVVTAASLMIVTTFGLGLFNIALGNERQKAEENYVIARKAVDEILSDLGAIELVDIPRMEEVRRLTIGKAFDFYQMFLRERGQDPRRVRDAGCASRRLGDIEEMLGNYVAAERAYREAIRLLKKVDEPSELATAHYGQGLLYKKSLRYEESERELREALRLYDSEKQVGPISQAKNNTIYHLGALLARQVGKGQAADTLYKLAVKNQVQLVTSAQDRPSTRRMLARYQNNVGILLKRIDPEQALVVFRDAVIIQDELSAKSPTIAGLHWERARTRANLGTTLAVLGQVEPGIIELRQAEKGLASLTNDYPSVPDYIIELASIRENIAAYLHKLGMRREATTTLDLAVDSLLEVSTRFPGRPDIRLILAKAERTRGMLQHGTVEAHRSYQASRTLLEALQKVVPEIARSPEFLGALAAAFNGLATARYEPGTHDETTLLAIRGELVDAISLYRRADGLSTVNREYEESLIHATIYLIQIDIELNELDQAASQARALPDLQPKNLKLPVKAAGLLAACADAAESGSSVQRRAIEESILQLRKALQTDSLTLEALGGLEFAPLRAVPEFIDLFNELQSRDSVTSC